MNRRQKIIVSVTGIFLVLLILVGLTYAYFLTQIEGNPNTKSISVTTANLRLTYTDGNGILTPANMLVPGDAIKFKDSNNNEVDSKTFTVTNNGDDTEYVIFIDNVSVTYASTTDKVTEGDTTTFESNDFRYTLTCTITSSDATRNNTSCSGVEDGVFPLTNESVLVGNDIMKGDVHNYTLTMEYKETDVDQSNDMNKTLSAQINIEDINRLNPYSDNEDSLAYNIINNAINKTNGTALMATPETKVAEEISYTKSTGKIINVTVEVASYNWTYAETKGDAEDGIEVTACTDELIGMWLYDASGYFDKAETIDLIQVTGCNGDKPMYAQEEMLYEKALSVTADDYGTSYYYRGNVEDNYVTFSNKCWRIVRIQGDGSIKLTLESQSPCSENMTNDYLIGITNWGYKIENDTYIGDYKNSKSGMKNKLTTWLNETNANGERTNITTKSEKLLKTEEWCLGNITNTYAYNSPYGELGTTATQNYTSGTSFYYETARNLYGKGVTPNATLKCNGETDLSKIGALTADEVVFAGGKVSSENSNYYLSNNSRVYWWTLSRSYFEPLDEMVFHVGSDEGWDEFSLGGIYDAFVGFYEGIEVRPAITLKSGSVITNGVGTIGNPYVIE